MLWKPPLLSCLLAAAMSAATAVGPDHQTHEGSRLTEAVKKLEVATAMNTATAVLIPDQELHEGSMLEEAATKLDVAFKLEPAFSNLHESLHKPVNPGSQQEAILEVGIECTQASIDRTHADIDYTRAGPYEVASSSAAVLVPWEGGSSLSLQVKLTAPKHGATPVDTPCTLLHLFNGFQMPSSSYTYYAERLATWGYISVQYDLPGLLLKKIIPDDKELALSPVLRAWVLERAQEPASIVYGLLDSSSILKTAAVGHSRGGKLAALMLAGDPAVAAAVLIDPVDMTAATKNMGYPSAVDALEGKNKVVALIGAGHCGICNPSGEGYHKFWPVLADGSWQLVLPKAGHMQFTSLSGPIGWAFDRLCGSGNVTHEEVMSVVSITVVAWLEQSIHPERAARGVPSFLSWVQQQVASGGMSFDTEHSPAAAQSLQRPTS